MFVGITCSPLDDPNNGSVNTSRRITVGDVSRYSCDKGYMVNGTADRTCQADGQWSGSMPTCESEILEQ